MFTRAIILAAGSSERMGRPKALLELGGESFVRRLIRVFREGSADEIVIVVGGPHESEIRVALPEGVRVVTNPDPEDGPITSVRAGIGDDEAVDAYLVHPVDIPGLEPADVQSILEAAAAERAEVYFPSIDGRRGHPVLIRASLGPRILALPRGRSLRDLFGEPDIAFDTVTRESRWLRFDVDTPEDLATLQREWRSTGESPLP